MQPADGQERQIYYGCVFCRTTREKAVARALEEQFPGLKATAVSQIKHKSEKGRKFSIEQVLLPGYVFFQSTNNSNDFFHIQNVIRVLKNSEGSWQLYGTDASFAHFVFEREGFIGISKARQVGDKVKICEGPLKDLEGCIVKIDRRSRNGQVEFRFDDRVWRVWLAFEMVE